MRLDSFLLTPEITGKHSDKFLKNAKNKNLLKITRINTEIQTNRGAHFLHLAWQAGRRSLLPPRQLRHWSKSGTWILKFNEV